MTNKKLALITCYFQPNYGSQLQAYATQLLFDKMKVENEQSVLMGCKVRLIKRNIAIF